MLNVDVTKKRKEKKRIYLGTSPNSLSYWVEMVL
jgi:hypothetical protein